MQRKIAFIHYPAYGASFARLETMPFALNSVLALAKSGWIVDLFLWEKPSQNYEELLPKNVIVNYLSEPANNFSKYFQPAQLRLQFCLKSNYICVFGVGQIGGYIAAIVARSSRAPFIYLNDEFPDENSLSFNIRRWSRLESRIIKSASILVLPDKNRFEPLCQKIGINDLIPNAELPNITINKYQNQAIDWYQRFGIPNDKIVFLHAGALDDWTQIPELLSSVPYWHEKAVLLLHSRSRQGVEKYRKQLAHLDIPGKVYWSDEPLSEGQLNALVRFSTGNFALYRNIGLTIEYIGFSSGKLMRSLACGTPVIASKFKSLNFVEDEQVGMLVNHPSEIPKAIEKIIKHQNIYRENCVRFCEEFASFEKAWKELCGKVKLTTGIDLLIPR